MNKLSEFYRDLLAVVNIYTDETGMLYLDIDGVKKPVELNGVNLYLPTDENVRTSTEIVDGKPKVTKALFNPLQEDEIKGANNSFNKFKTMIEYKLLGVVSQLGIELMKIINNKEEINDMELTKFVNTLNSIKTKEKVLIDDKSIKQWVQIYTNIINDGAKVKYVKFFIKKGGVLDNVKYNRIGTITYPFVDELNKASEKKEALLGVKLRRKDFNVYLSIMRYLFKHFEPEGINQYGSLNRKSPSLHILLLMYNNIYERLEDIIESVSNLDLEDDVRERIYLGKLPIRIESFSEFIDDIENEIRRVPLENNQQQTNVVNGPKVINEVKAKVESNTSSGGDFWVRVKNKNNTNQQVNEQVVRPVAQQVAPVAPVMPVMPVQNNPFTAGGMNTNPFNQGRGFNNRAIAEDPWAPKQQGYGMGVPNNGYGQQANMGLYRQNNFGW